MASAIGTAHGNMTSALSDLAPREWPQQQQRAELAEDKPEELRSEREDKGVAQRSEKVRVLHDLREVRQANEVP